MKSNQVLNKDLKFDHAPKKILIEMTLKKKYLNNLVKCTTVIA